MFFCPVCAGWIAKSVLSQMLNEEADAALHRLEHSNPALAAALYIVTPVAITVGVAWAAPKIWRFLNS